MTCFLQYSKIGDEEYLEGTYTSMNVEDSSNCGRGTVFLRKVTTSDFYKEPFLIKREKEKAPVKKPDTLAQNPVIAKVIPQKTTTQKPPIKKPIATTPHPTAKKPSAGNKTPTGNPTVRKPTVTKPPVKTTNPPVATVIPKTNTPLVDTVQKIERKTIPVV